MYKGLRIRLELIEAVPLWYAVFVFHSRGTRKTLPKPCAAFAPYFYLHCKYSTHWPVIGESRFPTDIRQLLNATTAPQYSITPEI